MTKKRCVASACSTRCCASFLRGVQDLPDPCNSNSTLKPSAEWGVAARYAESQVKQTSMHASNHSQRQLRVGPSANPGHPQETLLQPSHIELKCTLSQSMML